MKAYVVTTGVVSGLLALAHVARVMMEGWGAAADPIFILTTVGSAGLCVWAWRVLRKMARP